MEIICCIIGSFFRKVLYHDLDKFLAIFKENILSEKLRTKANTYISLIGILNLLYNDSKNYQGIVIIVFRIEIDISLLIIHLLQYKLKKEIKAMSKFLNQKTISFINI